MNLCGSSPLSVTETNRNRIPWVDIAKGLGMILVVIGHCNPPNEIKNTIASFHMPLFFLLTGIVYSTKQSNGKKIIKDIKRLIIPYLVTCGIIALFLVIIHKNGEKGYYDSIKSLTKSILMGSGSPYNGIKIIGEIWFLLGMFWTRRIMDAILLSDNKWMQTVLVVICVGASISLASTRIWIPLNIDIAFFAVGFVYIGWVLKKRIELIDDPGMLCVLMMLFFTARNTYTLGLSDRNYYSFWYVTIPGAIAMSIVICKLSKAISRVKGINHFLSFVGKHSLIFLCIHSIDWRMPFPRFGWTWITPYSQETWFWILHSVHRFTFDFLVTVIVVIIYSNFRKLANRIFNISHESSK